MPTLNTTRRVLLQVAAVDGKSVTQQGDEATGRCDSVAVSTSMQVRHEEAVFTHTRNPAAW